MKNSPDSDLYRYTVPPYSQESLPGPILRSNRLMLRPFKIMDMSWFVDLMNDPLSMYFSPQGPIGYKNAQEFLEHNILSFQLRLFGVMACCIQHEKVLEPIGFCGVALREIEGLLYPELGYRFFPHAWGFGYATEAALLVKEDAFQRLGFSEVFSFIEPANIGSIRVIQKIGGVFAFHAFFRGLRIALYRTSREKSTIDPYVSLYSK